MTTNAPDTTTPESVASRPDQRSGHAAAIAQWRALLVPSSATLRELAGTTEDEFLQIGSQMQDFYHRSSEITSMANRLVETVAGESGRSVITRLRQMIRSMEEYLASARDQSHENCTMLEQVMKLLEQVSEPLEGFQKMYKALRMLSISTKIESSRLGETGTGFLTLALDVEKLSHLVNEKSASILNHRQALLQMIGENLKAVRTSESSQEADLSGVLARTTQRLEELESVNNRCSTFGTTISEISVEVSNNISEVVASVQMHDMTRQQIEHIEDALKLLAGKLETAEGNSSSDESFRRLVMETGDICELQSAQLRHAANELCTAVESIISNLREIAGKQTMMASQTLETSGMTDPSGGSFVEHLNSGLAAVTSALTRCAQADRDMSATMKKVGDTMQEITGFVTDIEDIGSEIDLIALNSQIKAAHTGTEGAALGVLAEAIKRLSVDAVLQTEAVSRTLLQINGTTSRLFGETLEETEQLSTRVSVMEQELAVILEALGAMNADLVALLDELNGRVYALAGDIDQATAVLDVHERAGRMADEVEASLDTIVAQARAIAPASREFKENLRHMEERYTMQSERHIHEAIARKRSGAALGGPTAAPSPGAASIPAERESEFGDNVDLF